MSGPEVVATGKRITLTVATIMDAERSLKEVSQKDSRNLKRFAEGKVTIADQRAYLNRMWNSKNDRLFIIDRNPPHSNPIGSVGLHEIDWSNLTARVGMMIFSHDWRGFGFAGEALELLHKVAFEGLGLNRVYANIMVGNKVSLMMFRKYGYIEEGMLRQAYRRNGEFFDMQLFSLLKSDWS